MLALGLFFSAAAGILPADVVTPVSGPAFRCKVISVDEKSVTAKTDSETRVLDRASVRKIEFGDVLLTGWNGREYVNADYRVSVTLPAGWTSDPAPGFDMGASSSGRFVFLMKGINFEAGSGDAIKGAIGGMRATVPDALFSEAVDTTWAGVKAKRVSLKAPTNEGFIIFPTRPGFTVMILVVGKTGSSAAVAAKAAEWEKTFRFLD